MYRAVFFDGKSATAQPVSLSFENGILTISNAGRPEETIVCWRGDQLRRVPSTHSGQPLRLACKGHSEARLVVSDPASLDYLRLVLPDALYREPGLVKTIIQGVFLAGLALLAVALILSFIPWMARPVANMVPIRLEQQLGQGVYMELTRDWPACLANDEANGILNRLAERLRLNGAHGSGPKVIVVDAEVPNAFALPGGYILITNALMQSLQSPDELAGILAHELGHVVHRHSMVSLVERLGILFAINLIAGGSSSDLIATAGRHLTALSYSRDLERQADIHALEILQKLQISTEGYASFFARMAAESPADSTSARRLQSMISTHPLPAERASAARMVKVKEPRPALSAEDWATLRTICDAANAADAADEGD